MTQLIVYFTSKFVTPAYHDISKSISRVSRV